jgi:hypothetical protein
LQLATITHPTSIPLLTSSALLSTVGLSPLLLVTVGLLVRINRCSSKTHATRIQSKYIHLLRAPIIAAVALVICGGNISAGELVKKGVYKTNALITIGVSLLIFGFAAMVSILTWFIILRKYAEDQERRLVVAVVVSMPILLVRLTYAALIMFYNKGKFYILSDSVVILVAWR